MLTCKVLFSFYFDLHCAHILRISFAGARASTDIDFAAPQNLQYEENMHFFYNSMFLF